MNIPDQPIALSDQIHTYTELRQQIHDDLRIQHPEWVEANGESSMRLLELLDALARRGSNESVAANWKQLPLIGQGDQSGDSFKILVDREIRERRRDERRLADHCITTHQLQARNS
ncbi:MAG TPA: hypothetical protein VLQ29_09105 [Candidatus Dormibacteraeota bacterium]|nr:hypothetical protein [Candidatus Dormibacteraeota bacterium]